MAVITIAGQLGSGGLEIGRRAAQLLEFDLLDHELLVAAAQRFGASVEALEARDMHLSTLGERIASIMRNLLERSAAAGPADDVFLEQGGLSVLLARTYQEAGAAPATPADEVSDTKYLEMLRAVMTDLAQGGNIVLMGRGGQMILREMPNALHVRTIAPLELRIERVMESEGLIREAASKRVREEDHHRETFFRKFFHVSVDDPFQYHLILNTGKVSYEGAAQAIVAAAPVRAASG